MLLSSGVIWRHRDFDRFRAECPAGDEALQRTVFERLDEDLGGWSHSAPSPSRARRETRYHRRALRHARADRRTGRRGRRAGAPGRAAAKCCPKACPVVLATGGFQADRDLVRRHITPKSTSCCCAQPPGAPATACGSASKRAPRTSAGMDEFYGRNMPAPPARIGERDFVSLAQLYARHATVTNRDGEVFDRARGRRSTWCSGPRASRAPAPGTRSASVDLDERVRDRTVAEMVEAAERAGAPVERRDGARSRSRSSAAITTTLGGLRIDDARAGGSRRVRVRGGRGGHRDRRLRQRARGGARLRADRSGLGAGIVNDARRARVRQLGAASRLGIEEELLLVDPETRPPRACRSGGAADDRRARRAASHEVYAASIELRSPPPRGRRRRADVSSPRCGRRRAAPARR